MKIYLQQYRQFAGITAQELAEALNVSQATLSKYENGSKNVTTHFLEKAIDYLNKCGFPTGQILKMKDLFPKEKK